MKYYDYLKYCRDIEKVENYELAKADNFDGWIVHHKLENKCPVYKPTRQELIDAGLYYDRPANELVFMTRSEHITLHNEIVQASVDKRKGKKLSIEHRQKISKNNGKSKSIKVICVETGQIFESASAASKWLGAKTNCVAHAIKRNCKSYGYVFKYFYNK